MKNLWFVLSLLSAACSASTPSGDTTTVPGSPTLGLQYSGAIAQATPNGRVEISAPILPDPPIWSAQTGAAYPASHDALVSLVRDHTFSYEFLLVQCASGYPGITLATSGQQLTKAQLDANYDQVSHCAYERYGSKPYWVPQLLNDVDICATKLGADWRLLSEADLVSFTEADYKLFTDSMTLAQGSGWAAGFMYFSLDVFVRGQDGALKAGNMNAGAEHVAPLPIAADAMNQLYIGNGHPFGVRCVRVTKGV